MSGRDESRIRVAVVDDQPLERAGLALILDSDDGIEVVGEAGDGRAAVALVAADPPDVVLMDVRMPGMDGIAATRVITDSHPDTRVIVLTTFDLDDYAFGSLRAGASAFLLKSTGPEALVEAVKTVASGAAVVAPRLTARLIQHYLRAVASGEERNDGAGGAGGTVGTDGSGDTGGAGGPRASAAASASRLEALSPREHDVFAAVVRGLTNSEIGEELFLAPSTVKSHVNSIFAKLHLRDRVHAVILGYELGLGPE